MGGNYSAPEKESIYYESVVSELPSMEGKVVVVTGTTSGTGYVFARTLAAKGAEVVMLNRASQRAENALKTLQETCPGKKFVHVECDLMDFDSVRKATEKIKKKYDKIDVLCNNAGVMALEDKATKQGYDIQMQTNMISHFLLTMELYPLIAKSSDGRIINHTSIARLGNNLDAKYLGKNGGKLGGNGSSVIFNGGRWERYHQTKLADAIFTYAIQARVEAAGDKVKVLLAHPGVAATSLQETTAKDGGMNVWITKGFMYYSQSIEDGSLGIIMCACEPNVESGDFFGPGNGRLAFRGKPFKLKPEENLLDKKQQDILWRSCEEAVGEFKI